MGDQTKADGMWRQAINKEKKTYRMTYKPLELLLRERVEQEARAMRGVGSQPRPASAPSRPRPTSAPPGKRSMQVGDSVRISGMQQRCELNGVVGKLVHELPDEAGRVCVHIPVASASLRGLSASPLASGKLMRIQADRLHEPTPSEADFQLAGPGNAQTTLHERVCNSPTYSTSTRTTRRGGSRERHRQRLGRAHRSKSAVELIARAEPGCSGHRGFARKLDGSYYSER